ncbi:venom allergen 3 [Diachasma alloeum]|uniref:venom allergen 3 n=1 Tax=Diachasma alloeum TaxID=454923 RepID=UPI0007384D34|nr:venom allergen 3 [Diachasma alloeum]
MSRIFAQVLLLCGLVLISCQQERYCNLPSCREEPHTLCLYRSTSPSPSCGQLGRRGLTQGEKNALLNRHNWYRAYVASGRETRGAPGPQPAARNLGPLTWNDEVAAIAQRWADQCNYGHDRCRNTADDTYVGQNVAYIGWSDRWRNESLLQMVDFWYNEVADFNSHLVRALFLPLNPLAPVIGHYTQMVWAETIWLGCGASRYRRDGGYYITFLVCNYAPGGNYVGQAIYEIL